MKLAAIGVALIAVCAAQAQITLDDFTSGPAQFSVTSGQSYYEQTGSMIGGARTESLDVLSNPLNNPLDVTVVTGFASISEGAEIVSNDSLGYGYTASSDHATVSTFDLGLNLSSQSYFELDVAFNQVAMTGDIMLNNNSSELYHFNIAASSTPIAYQVAFSQFSGVNFADVHQISVDFQDTISNDFTVSKFVAAPEPIPAAFLGLSAIGIILRKRKR